MMIPKWPSMISMWSQSAPQSITWAVRTAIEEENVPYYSLFQDWRNRLGTKFSCRPGGMNLRELMGQSLFLMPSSRRNWLFLRVLIATRLGPGWCTQRKLCSTNLRIFTKNNLRKATGIIFTSVNTLQLGLFTAYVTP